MLFTLICPLPKAVKSSTLTSNKTQKIHPGNATISFTPAAQRGASIAIKKLRLASINAFNCTFLNHVEMAIKYPYATWEDFPPQCLCTMPLYLDFLGFYTNAKKPNGGHFAAGTIQEYCRKLINEVTHFYTLIIRFYSEHNFERPKA